MECVICHQEIEPGEEVYLVKRGIYYPRVYLEANVNSTFWIDKTYLDENLCHVSCLMKAGIDLTCLMFDLER